MALVSIPAEVGVGGRKMMEERSTFQFAPDTTHSWEAGGGFRFRLGPKSSVDGSGLSGWAAALSSPAPPASSCHTHRHRQSCFASSHCASAQVTSMGPQRLILASPTAMP